MTILLSQVHEEIFLLKTLQTLSILLLFWYFQAAVAQHIGYQPLFTVARYMEHRAYVTRAFTLGLLAVRQVSLKIMF